MGRKGQPKAGAQAVSGTPRISEDPESYLAQKPAWRFNAFDWDGPWGVDACAAAKWRLHIEQHLANLETMTWSEILKTAGGKKAGRGNNHHPIEREKFSKEARRRLEELCIYAEQLFSLRLEKCVRLYGIRQGNCLQVLWFDPWHCDRDGRAAYGWS